MLRQVQCRAAAKADAASRHLPKHHALWPQARRLVRKLCIGMVLQTDMQQHLSTVTRFQLRLRAGGDWNGDLPTLQLVLGMAIKVSSTPGMLPRSQHAVRRCSWCMGQQRWNRMTYWCAGGRPDAAAPCAGAGDG